MAMETSQSLLKESVQFAEELQVALEKEKETQVELRTAKEAAEAANEAKHQIMANIPMSCVRHCMGSLTLLT